LAVVLAVVGVLLGMFAFTALSDRAGAVGYRPEQSEVSLFALPNVGFGGTSGEPYQNAYLYAAAAIDTTNFPTGATFTFNVSGAGLWVTGSYCWRLVEVDPPSTLNPIAGSEVCETVSVAGEYFALQSGPLTLSAGEHIYTFQGKQVTGPEPTGPSIGAIGTARVVAEWTEPSAAVGGIALLPDISDSSAYNYIALAGVAAAVLFTLAAGVRHARRRFSRD
jgi:hypothetical protein